MNLRAWLGIQSHSSLSRSTVTRRSSTIGLIANVILFGSKLTAGIASNSVALINDAFNHLSDSLTFIVLFIGMKFSRQAPDSDHPQGHGRYEYLTSMFIGLLIGGVGVQLILASIDRIMHPVPTSTNLWGILILALAIFLKWGLYVLNSLIYKKYHSLPHRATAQDSVNDVVISASILIVLIIAPYVNLPLDGMVGLLVAGFILFSAYKIVQKAVQVLLGMALDESTAQGIEHTIKTMPGVLGIHRFESHDYGPDRVLATVHVEVSDQLSLIEAHHIIDAIEVAIERRYGIRLLVHLDPVSSNPVVCEKVMQLILPILSSVDQEGKIHQLHVIEGSIITDIVVTWKTTSISSDDGLSSQLKKAIERRHPTFQVSITIQR